MPCGQDCTSNVFLQTARQRQSQAQYLWPSGRYSIMKMDYKSILNLYEPGSSSLLGDLGMCHISGESSKVKIR